MGGSVSLIFGLHNHQPVGNFDSVFEYATDRSYAPFLQMLNEFPDIRVTMHFTGVLFDWLDARRPEVLALLADLVERGQVEMMTGGYYEPIMPIIPDRDKKGQIRKLTQYVRNRLGGKPTGMWLAERVWEPYLAKPLAEAGVRYVTMDDSHFKYAGLHGEELFGYYYTEEQGVPLALFPISEQLRYLIPFRPPEKTIDFLKGLVTPEGKNVLVIADDGEKFGVWPDTYEWVYEKGWLRQFFELLQENREWLKVISFQDALREHKSRGPIYIPNASYTEMMEWVLPPAQGRELERLTHKEDPGPYAPFIRGGFWRNFLVKYRESNNMHKKMLYVSDRVGKLKGEVRKTAEDALWAGQCNCGYWHGVFGGLYLNHIRQAVYRNLIKAQTIVEEATQPAGPWVRIEEMDFYRDGGSCIIADTDLFGLGFDLRNGGMLFELDHKPKSFNALNTMTRREEAYHQKILNPPKEKPKDGEAQSIHDLVILKEADLARHLVYDWYRRSSFIDHFLGEGTTLHQFAGSHYREDGDFANQPYRGQWEEQDGSATLILSRNGHVRTWQGEYPIYVEKSFSLKGGESRIGVRYRLYTTGDRSVRVRFGMECGFALQAGDTPDRYYVFPDTDEHPRLGATGERKNIRWLSLIEEWIGLEIVIAFEREFDLWHFPIETVSSSEGGFERTYQSSVVLPHWEFELVPGQQVILDGELDLVDLKNTPGKSRR